MNNIPVRYLSSSKKIPVGSYTREVGIALIPGMDINEIRLANLRSLTERAGSRKQLATMLGMSYALLNNYIGRTPTKRVGDKTARNAEVVFALPHGWMDAQHAEVPAVPRALSDWPFQIERIRFDRLPESEKSRIDRFVKDTVESWEAMSQVESLKAG